MIIKAGDKVDESKIQRLYWASKEVKSQFHRIIGNDKPLEAGNADDVLTMVIYNSPEEYKLNRTLYGYSVDNGGIYIEGIGTFFTYERTPEESIYSLEELFRHEFTHYLQGRYLVPGLFNEGDFYKGNSGRITWFEEGSAEFLQAQLELLYYQENQWLVDFLKTLKKDLVQIRYYIQNMMMDGNSTNMDMLSQIICIITAKNYLAI